jgi:hypothetical protein
MSPVLETRDQCMFWDGEICHVKWYDTPYRSGTCSLCPDKEEETMDSKTDTYTATVTIKIDEHNKYGENIGSGNLKWTGNLKAKTLGEIGMLLQRIDAMIRESLWRHKWLSRVRNRSASSEYATYAESIWRMMQTALQA